MQSAERQALAQQIVVTQLMLLGSARKGTRTTTSHSTKTTTRHVKSLRRPVNKEKA